MTSTIRYDIVCSSHHHLHRKSTRLIHVLTMALRALRRANATTSGLRSPFLLLRRSIWMIEERILAVDFCLRHLGNKNRFSRACFASPWRRLMRLRILHFDVVMTEKLRTKVIYSMDGVRICLTVVDSLASVLSHVCVSLRSYVHHYSLHLPHLPLNSLTSKWIISISLSPLFFIADLY